MVVIIAHCGRDNTEKRLLQTSANICVHVFTSANICKHLHADANTCLQKWIFCAKTPHEMSVTPIWVYRVPYFRETFARTSRGCSETFAKIREILRTAAKIREGMPPDMQAEVKEDLRRKFLAAKARGVIGRKAE